MSNSQPLDPPISIAQKRTFEDFSSFPLKVTDFKMPLLKRAKFYKEQSVKEAMSQISQKNKEQTQEIQKKLEAHRQKLQEQQLVNQEVNRQVRELQKQAEKLQDKDKHSTDKILFLEDLVAIHGKYFLAQKRVTESEKELMVLEVVMNVISESQIDSIVLNSRSLSRFLDRLQGRLEALIQQRISTPADVDGEARCILVGVGFNNLKKTQYTRESFAEELVAFLLKSCVQNQAENRPN